ncbi:hypothetical protein [Fusobacterium sp. SYSU M8D902]|uniref:hypothetical protein n=1 Tax=Fusobacterium sp. SYSU M8D902 TaxID=3159562 RepID=UPI0032E391B0
MRSKIVATVILILSIVALFNYYPSLKNYNYIKKGNKNTLAKEFDLGRENYKKSLDIEKNSRVDSNILKSFYFEKKYDEVVKAPADENFLKGNSYAYLGDQDAQNSKSFYEKALAEYKLGMKKSDDINIKKNYELILQKIKESDKKEQNKDNKENKDQKDKEKNQDKQDQNNKKDQNKDQQQDQNNKQEQNRDQNNNTENQSQNQQKQDEKENKNSEQKQDSQKNGDEQKNSNSDNQNDNENKKQNSQPEKDDSKDPQEQKDNSKGNSGQTEGEMSEKEIKEQEIKAILKRLEGNEKQSFKNNERMLNINNNTPSNRW